MTEILTNETVKRVAELARLHLSDNEVQFYKSELQKILKAFQDLTQSKSHSGERSDTLFKMISQPEESFSCMQKDTVQNVLHKASFLNQVPDKEGAFVRVPAILSSTT